MPRRIRTATHAAVAAVVSGLVLALLALGIGPVPALGTALVPGAGVWDSAAGAELPHTETLDLAGLKAPVTVAFDDNGVPTVKAGSDDDLFQAQGYLHARFRLAQLDLERRAGRGRLAELNGPASLESDRFELQMGLLRTAEAEWAATPPDSPAGRALTSYTRGVNAWISELRHNGQWPAIFSLTGVHPADWTPVDSLVIQEVLTQSMDFTSTPLDYAIFRDSLGAQRTMDWFPVHAANDQRPYDPGPYRDLGTAPLPANVNSAGPDVPAAANRSQPRPAPVAPTGAPDPAGEATAARTLLDTIRALPATQMHTFPDSNAWVANGPAVAGGNAMLAGDPHLPTTLPSYWYQIALSSPETNATGASMAGMPGVLIGRNADISWSLTDAQNQSTVFYSERTSPDHPGQYFWNNAWHPMQRVEYTIPVRGGDTEHLAVDLTVHGPVITRAGQTTSVSWMGNVPSPDLAVLLAVDKARNYQEFRTALADWHAPTLNFAYADGGGNIGVVAAGYFPLTKAGDPWFPLPGTGEYDVVGAIPFDATPQAYNPPNHVIATANQRPVSADYPYYIGTSFNAFDNGYRAARIYQFLESHPAMTAADFTTLQNDTTDYLATVILPHLKEALAGTKLDARQQAALDVLDRWDSTMRPSVAGGPIWWTFWNDYLETTFQPWWDQAKVPVEKDRWYLKVSSALPSLDEDLEAWTLHDPANPAFTSPGGPTRTAPDAMRTAFAQAVSELSQDLGSDPATWTWDRVHTRQVPSLTDADALGYGPVPAEGDRWTVNAADGGMNSTFGPSWRMVVDWKGPGSATAQAVYPGGQSENPASPWYRTFIPYWRDGRSLPLLMAADQPASTKVWTLRPGA
ncbi:penicillin amidase [Kitasatospora aureofaciens]|uniref:Penicillin amidase n=1 Tax=Kitasatospora aureofaciens TaxID=1894 RepID=A0A8H9HDT8_KITAU|nr:penicillin acylase family protein [Streptomyces viridifaciens]GGU56837.1 penicillin amidase [Kitasatospora aureofaciens]